MEKSMRKPHSKPPAVSVKQPRAHLQQPLESQDGGGNSFLSGMRSEAAPFFTVHS